MRKRGDQFHITFQVFSWTVHVFRRSYLCVWKLCELIPGGRLALAAGVEAGGIIAEAGYVCWEPAYTPK